MRYGVLGPLEVHDSSEVVDVGPLQRRRVLAVLLGSANAVVSRDRLVQAVWGDSAGATATASLHAHVSRLRGLLGRDAIVTRSGGYVVRTGPDDFDVEVFERLLAEGRRSIAGGALEAGRDQIANALAVWRGEPFLEFSYEQWAQPIIARLSGSRLDAVEARAEAELILGRHVEVVEELEELAVMHPGREGLCQQLMLALYRCGRQRDALDRYERHRAHHRDSAGLVPSPSLRALQHRILNHDPQLDVVSRPPVAPTRTMAIVALEYPHRLRYRRGGRTPNGSVTVSPHLDIVLQTPSTLVGVAENPIAAVEAAVRLVRDATTLESSKAAVHVGELEQRGSGYVGLPLHQAVRLARRGTRGEILVSADLLHRARGLLPGPAGAVEDRGVHGLPGSAQPERIYRLVRDDLPPPADQATPRSTNLPARLTSFVGRAAELATISTLVQAQRLVTITGPGGAGKTSLALQAAASEVGTYPDGVWWVDVSQCTNAGELVGAVWATLGFVRSPATDPAAELVMSLANRELILVLDNCETVLDGAAHLVERILHHCPTIRVLATSREPLAVPGECKWSIPLLLLPDASEPGDIDLHRYEALRLFDDRARGANPSLRLGRRDLPAIIDICRRVDGLPLGIELAAAQLSHVGVEELRAELAVSLAPLVSPLRTVPDRQRTLTATIRWSYTALDGEAQRLLDWLSVFEAPIRPADVASIEELGLLDVSVSRVALASLADKGLLERLQTPDGIRYRMLDSIRAVARDNLDARDERRHAVRAHARHFTALARAASVGAYEGEAPWLSQIVETEANLVRALEWCLINDPDDGAKALVGVGWFYSRRKYWSEALRELGEALIESPSVEPATSCLLLTQTTYIEAFRAPTPQLATRVESILRDPAASSETKSIAGWTYHYLGTLNKNDRADAYPLAIEAFAEDGTLASEKRMADIRYAEAYIAGDYGTARQQVLRQIDLCTQMGAITVLPGLYSCLADIDRLLGSLATALEAAKHSLRLADSLPIPYCRAWELSVLAEIRLEIGPAIDALELAAAAAREAINVDAIDFQLFSFLITALACARVGQRELAHRLCAVALHRKLQDGGFWCPLEPQYEALVEETLAAGHRDDATPVGPVAPLLDEVERVILIERARASSRGADTRH